MPKRDMQRVTKTRVGAASRGRVCVLLANGALVLLSACVEPLPSSVGDGDGDSFAEREPMCELAAPCPSNEEELTSSGDTFTRVERSRVDTFDPSTCPPASVTTTRGRSDAVGRTVSYRTELDDDDDGELDYASRLERTFHGDDLTSPLATETRWEDHDGDAVDDVRYHYVYPIPGESPERFTVYVDYDDDSVIDSIFVTLWERSSEGSTTVETSTQFQDLDGDFVDDLVSVSVSTSIDGVFISSHTTVTAPDDSLNSFSSTTATYSEDVDVFETEIDLLHDDTIDERYRFVTTRFEDGSFESTSESDDDADGVIDRIYVSRSESVDVNVTRWTFINDDNADGTPERVQRHDTWFALPDLRPDGTRVWFDDDGDQIFERIYTTHYSGTSVVAREYAHERDGTISFATYDEAFCSMTF